MARSPGAVGCSEADRRPELASQVTVLSWSSGARSLELGSWRNDVASVGGELVQHGGRQAPLFSEVRSPRGFPLKPAVGRLLRGLATAPGCSRRVRLLGTSRGFGGQCSNGKTLQNSDTGGGGGVPCGWAQRSPRAQAGNSAAVGCVSSTQAAPAPASLSHLTDDKTAQDGTASVAGRQPTRHRPVHTALTPLPGQMDAVWWS